MAAAESGEGLERMRYAQDAVSVLRQTAEMLRPMNGRRKAILYVGEGIDYEMGSRTIDLMQEVNTFLATVSRANVVMYTLDPTGMRGPELGVEQWGSGAGDFARALDDVAARAYTTLRAWAAESGGVAAVNTNDLDRGLASIVEHASRYYVLGYETPVENDGRFHRIEVRAALPGLTVQSRRGYLAAPPPGAKTPAASAAAAASVLDRALASPIPATAARVRLFAAPFRGNGPKHDVLLGVHIDGRDLGLTAGPADTVASAVVELVVLDEAGRVAASTRNTIELTIRATNIAAVQERGLRYLDRVALTPGRYHARAGVALEGDRVATVAVPFDVPDFATPRVSMSGLLVSSRRPEPGHSTGPYFSEWLPAPATAQRRFAREDDVTVFAEVYGDGKPRPLTLVRKVLNARGDVEFEEDQPIEPGGALDGRPIPLRSTVPLLALTPGPYRLRFEVRDGGVPAAARELSFVVADGAEQQR